MRRAESIPPVVGHRSVERDSAARGIGSVAKTCARSPALRVPNGGFMMTVLRVLTRGTPSTHTGCTPSATLTRSPRAERRVHDDCIERIRRSRLERAAPEKVQRASKHVRLDELHGRAHSKRRRCGGLGVGLGFDTAAFVARATCEAQHAAGCDVCSMS